MKMQKKTQYFDVTAFPILGEVKTADGHILRQRGAPIAMRVTGTSLHDAKKRVEKEMGSYTQKSFDEDGIPKYKAIPGLVVTNRRREHAPISKLCEGLIAKINGDRQFAEYLANQM